MGEENPLRTLLEQEVPDWRDDDFARARFKAFSGQKHDWQEKLTFWRDLIIKVAKHLDLVVIDTQTVQQKWFIRDGLVPMGLPYVLVEMKKSGELQTIDQVLGGQSSMFQWVGTVLKKAISWAGLLSDSYAETEVAVEDRLVVVAVLQERVVRFVKTLADEHYAADYIATSDKLQELCGGSEDAELVIGSLMIQNKARFLKVAGGDRVELGAFGRASKYL